jgi:hypothetical protein
MKYRPESGWIESFEARYSDCSSGGVASRWGSVPRIGILHHRTEAPTENVQNSRKGVFLRCDGPYRAAGGSSGWVGCYDGKSPKE